MNNNKNSKKDPYIMKFGRGTIKHLGLQMYSTLPPVIGELVANAWDANATKVEIEIPKTLIDYNNSEIIIRDNGIGMSDEDVRDKYLYVGRDRRKDNPNEKTPTPYERDIMGRKGIGKFSAFGIAEEITIESSNGKDVAHFKMNYSELLEEEDNQEIKFPPLPPTGEVQIGTQITLKCITKFKTRPIQITTLRRALARRFAVIADQYFEVLINGELIKPEDRDLKNKLEKDADDNPYLWEYDNVEIEEGTGWTVSGWIGALDKSLKTVNKGDRGIVLMARGKLVQEPFFFYANVGQQFALSYITGELHVEFVDQKDDMISTTRNTLVWDTEENEVLLNWGQAQVNMVASKWGEKRREDTEKKLNEHQSYIRFKEESEKIDKKREFNRADRLVKQIILKSIENNPGSEIKDYDPIIDLFLNFWRHDTFLDMAEDIKRTGIDNPEKILNLFREWEILEAKEMMKVTEGRITTIEKLDQMIETNALEKPDLHNFLKQFPWVIDPHWTLVDDEVTYTQLLNNKYPEDADVPEANKRIDFLCVNEGTNLSVVEIKRPQSRVSLKELNQIKSYIVFMRHYVQETNAPEFANRQVKGYLLCGSMVDTVESRGEKDILEKSDIYIVRYSELLRKVKQLHKAFLDRYNQLQAAKDENK